MLLPLPRNGMPVFVGRDSETADLDSYGPRILAVCWVVGILSSIVVGLRMYCKLKRSRQLWYDDHVLIIAWLFQTADIILITIDVALGAGQHMSALDQSVWHILERNGNISGTLSITAAALSKTSFGITLLRLTDGYTKWCIWFFLGTMDVALGLSAIFIWADSSRPGHSPPIAAYNLFSGSYSALVDITLAFFPWPLVWSLQMHRAEKIGIAVAMSMGVFAGIGAIAKVLQLPNLSNGDFTYYESQILIWGTVETAVTIIAVSVPFLRVLVVEARSSSALAHHFVPQLNFAADLGSEERFAVSRGSKEEQLRPK